MKRSRRVAGEVGFESARKRLVGVEPGKEFTAKAERDLQN